MPKSILLILPIYNSARYLDLAIKSIVEQTCLDWELELWDDRSSDRSLEIARIYAATDSRISAIPLTEHVGRSRLLATTTANRTNRYICWVDPDGILEPTALSDTLEIMESRTTLGMIYSQQNLIDESGLNLGLSKYSQIPYHHNRLLIDALCENFRLIRTEALDLAGGMDPSFAFAEDYDMMLRLSEVAQIDRLPLPLYSRRIYVRSEISLAEIEEHGCAFKAVKQALVRRGLASKYQALARELKIFLAPVQA